MQETFIGPPKLLVFGGNGFVGGRVCEEALNTGLSVVSINRSGPPKVSADWVSSVEWVQVWNCSETLMSQGALAIPAGCMHALSVSCQRPCVPQTWMTSCIS